MTDSVSLAQISRDRTTDSGSDRTRCHIDDPNSSSPTAEDGRGNPVFHKTQSSEPPDGGSAAWLVVLGAWCSSFCGFGWVNSIGVFQEYYQNELLSDYSPSTIAWIPSLQIFFLMGMGPIVGAIFDNYGPRLLLLAGSFLHIFGIMMASLGTKYYQILLAQGLCSGIGLSPIFYPTITCAAGWFNHKRGTALGVVFTGSSIGGVVYPIMVSHLIREVGYAWTMRICAFLILALLVIANLTVRAYQPPRPRKATRSQLLKPLTEVKFLLVTAGFFLFSFGYFVPLNYLPTQALSAGMRPNLAQYLVSIFNAASLFGRLSSGFLGDKFGRYNVFIVVCCLCGIWVLGIWLPATNDASIIAFAILFGFSSAPFAALATPLVMQISPVEEVGYRTGLVFFSAAVSGLIANPIGGGILDGGGGWVGLKVFCGVMCFGGTAFVAVARINKTGWNLLAQF